MLYIVFPRNSASESSLYIYIYIYTESRREMDVLEKPETRQLCECVCVFDGKKHYTGKKYKSFTGRMRSEFLFSPPRRYKKSFLGLFISFVEE